MSCRVYLQLALVSRAWLAGPGVFYFWNVFSFFNVFFKLFDFPCSYYYYFDFFLFKFLFLLHWLLLILLWLLQHLIWLFILILLIFYYLTSTNSSSNSTASLISSMPYSSPFSSTSSKVVQHVYLSIPWPNDRFVSITSSFAIELKTCTHSEIVTWISLLCFSFWHLGRENGLFKVGLCWFGPGAWA